MIKIELVKFEAQDVITASGVIEAPVTPETPACTHSETVAGAHTHPVHGYHENDRFCKACGELVWCPFLEK